MLDGQYKYILHFDKYQLPPVEAFWSVTMYGSDFYLVPNKINRYAIADYTPGLRYNDDGGHTTGDSRWRDIGFLSIPLYFYFHISLNESE
ncbi:MAG: DUF1214 domain-containing protein [Desulfosporosinus sp.]